MIYDIQCNARNRILYFVGHKLALKQSEFLTNIVACHVNIFHHTVLSYLLKSKCILLMY